MFVGALGTGCALLCSTVAAEVATIVALDKAESDIANEKSTTQKAIRIALTCLVAIGTLAIAFFAIEVIISAAAAFVAHEIGVDIFIFIYLGAVWVSMPIGLGAKRFMNSSLIKPFAEPNKVEAKPASTANLLDLN